ncbi:MAG: membrane protein [Nitrospirales bacterium]|nr:MAG: membrane protein [Nitrospirales bacterium]
MTVLFFVGVFLCAVLIILWGCSVFTNAVEWLGKRTNTPEGAVGSIFAALGTTLPETAIPVSAIFFTDGPSKTDVGMGAILGAPFTESTLILPILAILLLVFSRYGRRPPTFNLNALVVRTDLRCFLLAFSLGIGCALLPYRWLHLATAVFLIGLYVYYVTSKFSGQSSGDLNPVPLIFARKTALPSYGIILLQGVVGITTLIFGSQLFVYVAENMASTLEVSPLLLTLLIAPLATELPELANSVLWLRHRKDTLAISIITGAMVFQGTIPVAIGLVGTDWNLDSRALTPMILALLAMAVCYFHLKWLGHWRPWLLSGSAILYFGFLFSL